MNKVYSSPSDCPAAIPVFPLPGALLLPRGQMPLNIFEPRYLAMVDAALAGERVIGMVQPQPEAAGEVPGLCDVGCAGRVTQWAETGDGRYLITLTGIARFRIVAEMPEPGGFRRCAVDFAPYAADFVARAGEDEVDRRSVLDALERFAQANELKVDWKGIRKAANEALVNALAMMCPYEPRDKQALLEAPDLKARADLLVALTEIALNRLDGGAGNTLQ